MTDKELRKLSRAELLEMLIAQAEENQRLQEQLQALQAQLNDRRIAVEESGSIAEACLKLNHMFEAAQAAADDYIQNVRMRSARQDELAKQAEELTRQKITQMITEADERCRKMESDTEKKCAEMTRKAMREADSYWTQVSLKLDAYFKQHSDLRNLLTRDFPAVNGKDFDINI